MTQTTRLDNSTYNILIALGKEADFKGSFRKGSQRTKA